MLDARVADVKKEVGDETETQKTNREARQRQGGRGEAGQGTPGDSTTCCNML